MDVAKFLTIDNILITVGVVITLFFAGKASISLFKNDGKDLISEAAKKRIAFIELALVFINILEAFIAASLSASHGLPFAPRFGMHFIISIVSAIVGFSVFSQIEQAVLAIIDLVKARTASKLGVATLWTVKEVAEAIGAIIFTIGGPFVNFGIVYLTAPSSSWQLYVDLLKGTLIFDIAVLEQIPRLLTPMYFTILFHIGAVLYLGINSVDSIVANYKKKEADKAKKPPTKEIGFTQLIQFFVKHSNPILGRHIDFGTFAGFLNSKSTFDKTMLIIEWESIMENMSKLRSIGYDKKETRPNREAALKDFIDGMETFYKTIPGI